jgi:hypothetical protein
METARLRRSRHTCGTLVCLRRGLFNAKLFAHRVLLLLLLLLLHLILQLCASKYSAESAPVMFACHIEARQKEWHMHQK